MKKAEDTQRMMVVPEDSVQPAIIVDDETMDELNKIANGDKMAILKVWFQAAVGRDDNSREARQYMKQEISSGLKRKYQGVKKRLGF
ncbi:MAG: hypothetical protein OXT65_09085 [Alphaproteobacteria bacterium]|nr:hypothetical protein [Alphaproteobacteria bacterium]